MTAIKKVKKKKFKEVTILTAFDAVYVNIDSPTLKVLIPINKDSLKEQGFQKDDFVFVKSDIKMGFFIHNSILNQAKTALKNLNQPQAIGE